MAFINKTYFFFPNVSQSLPAGFWCKINE